ncbi:hypothetical protein GPECTOR_36g54 [Gonium pectorale]|uniref:3-deoxy-D-manno-octulosonic-acid transferase N-terminal domain-containing protein n=1 Tax=Gonium pectorale TaxID=33097 RepID=A0A150GBX7_GONPE|nr:hypothetical protein GPECTOR_36g54 [Gonium pectorale]|eukprot:KXZ47329.1 hypothetical protein GPECTOR_36g54 [Gonium pectorale]
MNKTDYVSLALEYNERVSVLLTTPCLDVYKLLLESLPQRVIIQLVPEYNPITVAAFLRKWQPQVGVFLDAPFQRELAIMAHASGVALALLNASLPGEEMLGWHTQLSSRRLLKQTLSSYRLIVPRSDVDVGRFRIFGATLQQMPGWSTDLQQASELGACATSLMGSRSRISRILQKRLAKRQLWVVANTVPGEEVPVARVHASLRSRHRGLLTVVAPQSAAAAPAVARRMTAEKRLRVELLSAVVKSADRLTPDLDVLVVDDPEALIPLYSMSEIVLVGGSMVPSVDGACSPAASAVAGCALLMGPYGGQYLTMAADLNHAAMVASEEAAAAVAQTGPAMRGVPAGSADTPRPSRDQQGGAGDEAQAGVAGSGGALRGLSVNARPALSDAVESDLSGVSPTWQQLVSEVQRPTLASRPMTAPPTVPEQFCLRAIPSTPSEDQSNRLLLYSGSRSGHASEDTRAFGYSVYSGTPASSVGSATPQPVMLDLDSSAAGQSYRSSVDRYRWTGQTVGFGYAYRDDDSSGSEGEEDAQLVEAETGRVALRERNAKGGRGKMARLEAYLTQGVALPLSASPEKLSRQGSPGSDACGGAASVPRSPGTYSSLTRRGSSDWLPSAASIAAAASEFIGGGAGDEKRPSWSGVDSQRDGDAELYGADTDCSGAEFFDALEDEVAPSLNATRSEQSQEVPQSLQDPASSTAADVCMTHHLPGHVSVLPPVTVSVPTPPVSPPHPPACSPDAAKGEVGPAKMTATEPQNSPARHFSPCDNEPEAQDPQRVPMPSRIRDSLPLASGVPMPSAASSPFASGLSSLPEESAAIFPDDDVFMPSAVCRAPGGSDGGSSTSSPFACGQTPQSATGADSAEFRTGQPINLRHDPSLAALLSPNDSGASDELARLMAQRQDGSSAATPTSDDWLPVPAQALALADSPQLNRASLEHYLQSMRVQLMLSSDTPSRSRSRTSALAPATQVNDSDSSALLAAVALPGVDAPTPASAAVADSATGIPDDAAGIPDGATASGGPSGMEMVPDTIKGIKIDPDEIDLLCDECALTIFSLGSASVELGPADDVALLSEPVSESLTLITAALDLCASGDSPTHRQASAGGDGPLSDFEFPPDSMTADSTSDSPTLMSQQSTALCAGGTAGGPQLTSTADGPAQHGTAEVNKASPGNSVAVAAAGVSASSAENGGGRASGHSSSSGMAPQADALTISASAIVSPFANSKYWDPHGATAAAAAVLHAAAPADEHPAEVDAERIVFSQYLYGNGPVPDVPAARAESSDVRGSSDEEAPSRAGPSPHEVAALYAVLDQASQSAYGGEARPLNRRPLHQVASIGSWLDEACILAHESEEAQRRQAEPLSPLAWYKPAEDDKPLEVVKPGFRAPMQSPIRPEVEGATTNVGAIESVRTMLFPPAPVLEGAAPGPERRSSLVFGLATLPPALAAAAAAAGAATPQVSSPAAALPSFPQPQSLPPLAQGSSSSAMSALAAALAAADSPRGRRNEVMLPRRPGSSGAIAGSASGSGAATARENSRSLDGFTATSKAAALDAAGGSSSPARSAHRDIPVRGRAATASSIPRSAADTDATEDGLRTQSFRFPGTKANSVSGGAGAGRASASAIEGVAWPITVVAPPRLGVATPKRALQRNLSAPGAVAAAVPSRRLNAVLPVDEDLEAGFERSLAELGARGCPSTRGAPSAEASTTHVHDDSSSAPSSCPSTPTSRIATTASSPFRDPTGGTLAQGLTAAIFNAAVTAAAAPSVADSFEDAFDTAVRSTPTASPIRQPLRESGHGYLSPARSRAGASSLLVARSPVVKGDGDDGMPLSPLANGFNSMFSPAASPARNPPRGVRCLDSDDDSGSDSPLPSLPNMGGRSSQPGSSARAARITLSGGPLVVPAAKPPRPPSRPRNSLPAAAEGSDSTNSSPGEVESAAAAAAAAAAGFSTPQRSRRSPRSPRFAEAASADMFNYEAAAAAGTPFAAGRPSSPPRSPIDRTSCPRAARPSASPVKPSLPPTYSFPPGNFAGTAVPLSPRRSVQSPPHSPTPRAPSSRDSLDLPRSPHAAYVSPCATDPRASPIKMPMTVGRTSRCVLSPESSPPRYGGSSAAAADVSGFSSSSSAADLTAAALLSAAGDARVPALPLSPPRYGARVATGPGFAGVAPIRTQVPPRPATAASTPARYTSPRQQRPSMARHGHQRSASSAEDGLLSMAMQLAAPLPLASASTGLRRPPTPRSQRSSASGMAAQMDAAVALEEDLHTKRSQQQHLWDVARVESRTASAAATPRSARVLFGGTDSRPPLPRPPSSSSSFGASGGSRTLASPEPAPLSPRAGSTVAGGMSLFALDGIESDRSFEPLWLGSAFGVATAQSAVSGAVPRPARVLFPTSTNTAAPAMPTAATFTTTAAAMMGLPSTSSWSPASRSLFADANAPSSDPLDAVLSRMGSPSIISPVMPAFPPRARGPADTLPLMPPFPSLPPRDRSFASATAEIAEGSPRSPAANMPPGPSLLMAMTPRGSTSATNVFTVDGAHTEPPPLATSPCEGSPMARRRLFRTSAPQLLAADVAAAVQASRSGLASASVGLLPCAGSVPLPGMPSPAQQAILAAAPLESQFEEAEAQVAGLPHEASAMYSPVAVAAAAYGFGTAPGGFPSPESTLPPAPFSAVQSQRPSTAPGLGAAARQAPPLSPRASSSRNNVNQFANASDLAVGVRGSVYAFPASSGAAVDVGTSGGKLSVGKKASQDGLSGAEGSASSQAQRQHAGQYLIPATQLPCGPRVGPAVWVVSGEDELASALSTLLRDPLERRSRGRAAAQGAAKLASSLVSTVWNVLEDLVITPALQKYISSEPTPDR